MTFTLSSRNLVLRYDKKAVIQDVSLEIEQGHLIGLIGPNGAGKTTLLLALSGQFRPYAGVIFFGDENIYEKNYQYKKQIGYVHENPFFYTYLTVEEFLIFVARVKGMLQNDIVRQIKELLQAFRLSEERSNHISELSQGMKKKLAMAAAFVDSPKIVFLDEALNGIDVESAFHIKKLLADFVKRGGTVILSTHVLEVIEKICDRYLVLRSGQIIADLPALNLKEIDLEQHILRLLNS